MSWKDNTGHVLIRRRYRCDDCGFVFDMRHKSADEPMPDCPRCVENGAAAAQMAYVPPMPAITTTKSKAIDLAQTIAEEDYGLTDMNDNQRAGDIAFKPPPPMQTAEREAALREMMQAGVPAELPLDQQQKVENYWQGNAGGAAENTIATEAVYKPASEAAMREGTDALNILEQGKAQGSMPLRLNVMSAVHSKDLPQELQQAQAARGT